MSDRRLIEPAPLSPGPQTAVVCDTTAYLPAELIEAHGIEADQPLRDARRRAAAGVRDRRPAGLLRAPARLGRRRRPPPSPRWATSSPSTSRCSTQGREIVSIHISAGISGTVEAAGQAQGPARGRGQGRRADPRSSTRGTAAGGLGLCVLAAAEAAGAGAGADEVAGSGLGRPATGTEDVVRGRHARVPAARRADRRRPGLDRLDPEDQADPHPRGGDHAGRAGADPGALDRAAARLRRASATSPAPTPGSSSTSRTRRRPPALADDCREIFGCEPVFLSEIGPVLGAHVGPGLLGVGSIPAGRLALS